MLNNTIRALSIAGMCLAIPAAATAQSIEEFYSGNTITVIVPFGPGGTTAALGEAVASTMGRYIPGNPDFQLEFMPGGGGMLGQNYAYKQAARDGTALFLPQDSTVVMQYTQPEAVEFDAREFNWLGVVAQSKHMLCIRKDTGAETIEDLKTKEAFVASSGIGSETDFYPRVAKALLGLDAMQIVPGFPGGSTESLVALEAGEMDGYTGGWQTWSGRPDLLEIVNCFIAFGNGRIQARPDIPNLLELVESDEDKQIVRFVESVGSIGRGVATPPDVPEDRLDAHRAAFQEMLEDPDFIEAMKARNIVMDSLPGEEAQRLITESLDVSPEVVERAKTIMSDESG